MKTATAPLPRSADRFASLAPAGKDVAQELTTIKDWCLARADEWYERGEMGPAREFLRNAAEVDPQDARVWIALGSLHYDLADYAQAGLAFVRAGQLDPANVRVYLHLALTHQQMGDLPQAELLFQHALGLAPDHALAASLFADFLMAQRRFDDARRLYDQLLDRRPDDLEVLLRLGVCYSHLQHVPVARRCFERMLVLDPANALARENLNVLNARSVSGAAA
jgi:tetratricopeptide (TPR) repeat protein